MSSALEQVENPAITLALNTATRESLGEVIRLLRKENEQLKLDLAQHLGNASEVIRLQAALCRLTCNCGPTDPDPAVHGPHCSYRGIVEKRNG